MKVVILTNEISPYCKGGGAGSFNSELAQALEAESVGVRVITINHTWMPPHEWWIFLENIPNIPLLRNLLFAYSASKLLKGHDFDILITDDFWGNLFFFNKVTKYIKIVFAHTTIQHIQKICYSLNPRILTKLSYLYFSCVEYVSIKKADHVFTPTMYALDIITWLLWEQKPYSLTPLWLRTYKKKKSFFNSDIKNIIWAGNKSELKGIKRLLYIQHELNKMDKDLKLTIVCTGDLTDLDNFITKNNLKVNVEVLPWCPREELYEKFIESDLLLLASYSENFPMILLEAAMLWVPFAFIENGGSETIWDKNDALIFLKDQSYLQIAEQILSKSVIDLKNNAEHAFQKYMQYYTHDKSLKNIVSIMRNIAFPS